MLPYMLAFTAVVISMQVDSSLSASVERLGAPTCRLGWLYYGGSCYSFGLSYETWPDAASICTALGAYLVEINSYAENEWVVGHLTANDLGSVWIGANEAIHRGTWEWARSGLRLTFSDWSGGQPSDPVGVFEDCLEIRKPFGYKWNDYVCSEKNRFVCEIRAIIHR